MQWDDQDIMKNLAKQILGKNKTDKMKVNLFYALSVFAVSDYLIRWREQMQRSFWF